jgi:hypothetical protein
VALPYAQRGGFLQISALTNKDPCDVGKPLQKKFGGAQIEMGGSCSFRFDRSIG